MTDELSSKYANAVKLPDGSLENFTLKVNGGSFYCVCGCNVFHKPNSDDIVLYQCNACDAQYRSDK